MIAILLMIEQIAQINAACPSGKWGGSCLNDCSCHPGGSNGIECNEISGMCDCQANYQSTQCDYCITDYYASSGTEGTDPVCVACNCVNGVNGECTNTFGVCSCQAGWKDTKCDVACGCYTTGTGGDTSCDQTSGACNCETEYTGTLCKSCAATYYASSGTNGINPTCTTCGCFSGGTVGGSLNCDASSGQCTCKSEYTGLKCNQCKAGYYASAGTNGINPTCSACGCDLTGTGGDTTCHITSGKCNCEDGYTGDKCNSACGCHTTGTTGGSEYCDQVTGICDCKSGYSGDKCKTCIGNYYVSSGTNGVNPTCSSCNCHSTGTGGDMTCGITSGECNCNTPYVGDQCRTCAVNYYVTAGTNNVNPTCTTCGCYSTGTGGDMTCGITSGSCNCLAPYTGAKCKNCATTYYASAGTNGINPTCTGCGCHLPGTGGDSTCNVNNGHCNCNAGYKGSKCNVLCDCHSTGSTGTACDQLSGECSCNTGYTGMKCDSCASTYYVTAGTNNVDPTCSTCGCYSTGTGGDMTCGITSGVCNCLAPYTGVKCKSCSTNHYVTSGTNGINPTCTGCGCHLPGTGGDATCHITTGHCNCNAGYKGSKCNVLCDCHSTGSTGTACNQFSGQCTCQAGYTGMKCDTCVANYYASAGTNGVNPTCSDCDCNLIGTGGDTVCDFNTGNCNCLDGYESRQCNTCESDHYVSAGTSGVTPTCTPCNCVPANSVDETCDDYTGQCNCLPGSAGTQCQDHTCYGIISSDPSVCFGNGNCTSVDVCDCYDNYYGDECENWDCFGVNMNHTTTCTQRFDPEYVDGGPVTSRGRGTCVSPDTCSCDFNFNQTCYGGDNCEYYVCLDTAGNPVVASPQNYTDGKVCSGFGWCGIEFGAPDRYANGSETPCNCYCQEGYFGLSCERWSCNDIDMIDTNVCTSLVNPNETAAPFAGRGQCVAYDVCQCEEGYGGEWCQYYQCNNAAGVPITASPDNYTAGAVCSNRGWCGIDYGAVGGRYQVGSDSPNTCFCMDGYFGDACQNSYCDGIASYAIDVCTKKYIGGSTHPASGRGTCTDTDNCVCQPEYGGDNCEYYVCNDGGGSPVIANMANYNADLVCSGHGTCGLSLLTVDATTIKTTGSSTPTVCYCDSGWGGPLCDLWTCNGIDYQNTATCNYKGNCTAFDTCACVPGPFGTTGTFCNNPKCSGLTGTAGCSNHGLCTLGVGYMSESYCACQYGYLEDDCSVLSCNGIAANNGSVCNGRGTCSSIDQCTGCDPGWSGQYCDIATCNGFSAESGYDACAHGDCVAPDTCSCHFGYSLDLSGKCTRISCNGILSTNPAVCSQHGECNPDENTPDICVCENGYYPAKYCNLWDCGDIPYNNASVCNERGPCVTPGICDCRSGPHGFEGNLCEFPICHGLRDPLACSEDAGTCTVSDPNNYCTCKSGYTGDQCQYFLCNGKASNDPTVCSNHGGTCVDANTCINCNANWTGSDCEIHICFGLEYTHQNVCSGHGSCVNTVPQIPECSCNSNYTGENCQYPICSGLSANDPSVCSSLGNCVGPDNCDCNDGYGGSDCDHYTCFGYDATSPLVCSGNGNCQTPNNCSCDAGFSGIKCNLTICDGVLSNDINVCSNNSGLCVGPNNCSCFENYNGQWCQYKSCFGIQGNNNSVCSGHGNCEKVDICKCDSGYVGINCQYPLCFGHSSNDNDACNGNGQCIDKDICNCTSGYTSNDCSTPICFGILSNNLTNVCSARGTCDSPDSCLCYPGYGGDQCNQFVCFQKLDTDPTVCTSSTSGNCTGPNICTCNTGYSGVECQINECFGILSNDQRVCSGFGSCTSYQQCDCLPDHYGQQCELYKCNNILSNNNTVCSSHGECFGHNQCKCASGYSGQFCEIVSCFGKTENNPEVCSSHGTCETLDNCNCDPDYSGNQCQKTSCFGIVDDNPSVCSTHGSCVSHDKCDCSHNFYGATCSVFSCYDTLSNDTNMCNGHGQCNSVNKCTCNANYVKEQCSHHLCYGISDDDQEVCSSHGVCKDVNTCECFEDFLGDHCEVFKCFGYFHDSHRVCSFGNGFCVSNDTCKCKAGFIGEKCSESVLSCNRNHAIARSSCEACTPGTKHSNCLSAVSEKAFNSDSQIEFEFKIPNRTENTIDCSRVFDYDTLSKLGDDPKCSWEAGTDMFRVQKGSGATISHGEALSVDMLPFDNNTDMYSNVVTTEEKHEASIYIPTFWDSDYSIIVYIVSGATIGVLVSLCISILTCIGCIFLFRYLSSKKESIYQSNLRRQQASKRYAVTSLNEGEYTADDDFESNSNDSRGNLLANGSGGGSDPGAENMPPLFGTPTTPTTNYYTPTDYSIDRHKKIYNYGFDF